MWPFFPLQTVVPVFCEEFPKSFLENGLCHHESLRYGPRGGSGNSWQDSALQPEVATTKARNQSNTKSHVRREHSIAETLKFENRFSALRVRPAESVVVTLINTSDSLTGILEFVEADVAPVARVVDGREDFETFRKALGIIGFVGVSWHSGNLKAQDTGQMLLVGAAVVFH